MKQISVGTIITDGNKMLICRPFGKRDEQGNFDIPKGCNEPNESFYRTAIRECFEETGIKLKRKDLVDLGKHKYNSKKDLYLYLCVLPSLPELRLLFCESTFMLGDEEVPEMVGYKYVDIEETHYLFKSLEKVLTEINICSIIRNMLS